MQLKEMLMRLVTEKRREDLEQIYRDQAERALSAARHFLRCRALAEDVTQDLFLALQDLAPEKVEAAPNCEAFLACRAISKASNRRRTEARIHARERAYARWHSEILLNDTVDDVLDLREALGTLSPELAAVVWLRYFDGASMEEIASVLETSTRTVQFRLSKAREFLARTLSRS